MRLIRGRASSLPLDRMQGGGTRLQVGVAHLPRKVKQSWLVSYHGLKSLHPAPTANTGLWERNHPPPSFCLRPNTRGSAPRRLTQDAVTQTPLLRQQKRQTSETSCLRRCRKHLLHPAPWPLLPWAPPLSPTQDSSSPSSGRTAGRAALDQGPVPALCQPCPAWPTVSAHALLGKGPSRIGRLTWERAGGGRGPSSSDAFLLREALEPGEEGAGTSVPSRACQQEGRTAAQEPTNNALKTW